MTLFNDQIPFTNRSFLSIILICFALGTCMAHGHRDIEAKSNSPSNAIPPEASKFSESEQPFFPPSEAPQGPTSEQGFGHSSSSFSAAFSDILKGTFRGNSLTMPGEIHSKNKKNVNKALEQICGRTDYPDVCVSTCLPYLSNNFDVKAVLEASIKACSYQIKFTISKITKYSASSPELATALADYKKQYSKALENLQKALDALQSRDLGTVTIVLSAVMADVSACESGFEDLKIKSSTMAKTDGLVSITANNCLSIASLIPS
ncbi:uncharacterized protein LOC133290683 [Gastrolobium bilobum]|uniref:uncharacterized protein LOC133290683 n=1 Tax=Gastrolobium bilobum TaxID=150636 RepID=UPI002AB11A22|nr:uncharacterized protein LOC133290683 [Gastrolobium bilobum]